MNERSLFPLAFVFLLAASVPAPADTLSFREGENSYAGTVDTELDAEHPDEPKGANITIRLEQGPETQGLLRFDGLVGEEPDRIPPGSTVGSAKLVLVPVGEEAFLPGITVSMHRVLVPWDESSTWNTTDSGIRQDGVESETQPVAQFATAGNGVPARFGDLAPSVQAWVDGAENHGWVFLSDSTHPWRFASSEAPSSRLRPLLTVQFVPPPATVDLALEKDVDDPTPPEGSVITFTVTVSNDTGDDATNVEVTDVLPAGLGFDSAAATSGSYDDGTGVWTAGTVAAASAESLSITATVTATAGDAIVNEAQITASDQPDDDPSNDGASVALVVQGTDFVERQLTAVTNQDSRPAVSPDGLTIVFDSNRTGARDLYAVPFTGGAAQPLLERPGVDQDPDWSPGGTTIVFSAVDSTGTNLWTVPASGGKATPLDTDAANADRFPSWSPDGTQVAYTKAGDIWRIPAAGGTPAQVTTDPGNDSHPSWSPDGTEIAFLSGRTGNNDVWRIPATGGTAVQVTTDPANDAAPDWSPDGTLIAFQSNRGGSGNDIWVIPAGGGVATQVTTDPGNDVQPDWAPNGVQIAFARGGGQADLWVVTLPEVLPFAEPGVTGVETPDPRLFRLGAARPNPFEEQTTLPLLLSTPVRARIAVYDVGGRLVRTLLERPLDAGDHLPTWDGRDRAGRRVAPGVYFVRFDANGAPAAGRKVVLRR